MKKLIAFLFSALLIGSAQADIPTVTDQHPLVFNAEIPVSGSYADVVLNFRLGSGTGILGLGTSDAPLTSFSTWLTYNDGTGHFNPAWSSLTASSDGSGFDTPQFLFSGLITGSMYSLHVSATGAPATQFSAFITAVPEPESWAMFLAGLGIMGAIARRRSTSRPA